MPHLTKRLNEFYAALADKGLDAALAVLNENVPHRYTAVYRLRESVLHNQALFDKLGEVRPDFLAAVPFTTSFCQFVFRDGSFSTSDSGADMRLNGHPYQGVMVSYTGVPITDSLGTGEIVGSLCHFDVTQHPLDEAEFELLQRAGRLIVPSMLKS